MSRLVATRHHHALTLAALLTAQLAAPRAASAGPECPAPKVPVGDRCLAVAEARKVIEEDRLRPGPVVAWVPSPRLGPKHARVTIIAISDYECHYCRRVEPTLQRLLRTYGKDLAVVWKNNPLPFHRNALPAAAAALAAQRQKRFRAYHARLVGAPLKRTPLRPVRPHHKPPSQPAPRLDDAALVRMAREVRLNLKRFEKDRRDPRLIAQIRNEQAAANALGLSGTPSFFINGRSLVGAQPYERFKKVVDEELDATRALRPADAHRRRAKLHLRTTFDLYWSTLVEGRRTPKGSTRGLPMGSTRVLPRGHEPSVGPADAPVTVVTFMDFECPFCSRTFPILRRLQAAHAADVRLVFKHLPLSFHDRAEPSARAAIAAHAQGRFWEMAERLLRNRRLLSDSHLAEHAKALNLDPERFDAALESPETTGVLRLDARDVVGAHVMGTPQTFINGRRVAGARPAAVFEAVLGTELALAKAVMAAGVPRAQVSERLVRPGAWAQVLDPAAAPAASLAVTGHPTLGGGPVEVQAFVDLFYLRGRQVLQRLREAVTEPELARRVRLVVRPLAPLHREPSRRAAVAALAAYRQGAFWDVLARLPAGPHGLLLPDSYDAAAEDAGLDWGAWLADMADPDLASGVAADQAAAAALGIAADPVVFVAGRRVTRAAARGRGGVDAVLLLAALDELAPPK